MMVLQLLAKMLAKGSFTIAVMVPGSLCLGEWARKERPQELAQYPLCQEQPVYTTPPDLSANRNVSAYKWLCIASERSTELWLRKPQKLVSLFLKKMHNANNERLVHWGISGTCIKDRILHIGKYVYYTFI